MDSSTLCSESRGTQGDRLMTPRPYFTYSAPRGSPARAVSDSVVAAPVVSGRYRAGPSDGLVCAPRAGATEVMLLEPREVVAAEPIPR